MASSETKKYLDGDGVIALLKKIAELKQLLYQKIEENSAETLVADLKQDVIDTLNSGMSMAEVNDAYNALTDDDPETNYDPAMPTT